MPIEITVSLIGIFAVLLGAWTGATISRKSAKDILKKEQFFATASKFKSTVIYELAGFFPIDQHWEKKDFHRLYDSIPRINSAAAEFRHFVTSKTDFDKAVKNYNKYCRETKEHEVFTLDFSKSMPEGKYKKDYMDEFKNIVEHLLAFADEL